MAAETPFRHLGETAPVQSFLCRSARWNGQPGSCAIDANEHAWHDQRRASKGKRARAARQEVLDQASAHKKGAFASAGQQPGSASRN
jgi:hypothetical protein